MKYHKTLQEQIDITISTFTSVRPYGVCRLHQHIVPSCPTLQFLQSDHKMSLIKVAWHMFRVKNIHSGSPSDP